MNPKKNIYKNIPPDPENPFKVPENYFKGVHQRVLERIRAEEEAPGEKSRQLFPESKMSAPLEGAKEQVGKSSGYKVSRGRKIYLQPYLTLAATISGIALVVYIVLQSVTGSRSGKDTYDIATLDRAGVIQDESILAETFTGEDEEPTYSDWDEDAIVYLASNEVDLLDLLDTN